MERTAAVADRRATGPWAAVTAALVFLVALNLRPAFTSVGPLLPRIGADESLSEGAQGLLGAVPLLAFATVSPLVHRFSRRLGVERSVLVALVLLAAGVVVRSFTGLGGLWAGTVVIGCAIAVGNVLMPTLVRRDYPAHVSRATGIYSACIIVAASAAAAVSVPLADALDWRGSLAFWAIPAVVVALLWLPRLRGEVPLADTAPFPRPAPGGSTDDAAVDDAPVHGTPPHDAPAAPPVWRRPVAWLVTAFMGLQSGAYYLVITWLPTIEMAAGVPEHRAGWHLFAFQIVGIVSALTVPRLMRPDSQVAAAVAASVPILVGALGLLLVPTWSLLWVVVCGLGTGSSLVVALTLIGLRGRTQHETTQLSGMAQSLGYLLAAAAPFLAGLLAERTGGWQLPLGVLVTVAVAQLVVAVPAGRPRA